VMVGVNKYADGTEKDANIPLLRIDESVQKRQIDNLGNVKATRITIADGAQFKGNVDMDV